ncbi:hypothetical protein GSI_08884 [Ganoderma sinense ZZ0214-1]|uniref:Peptidyl-prolyl cis-trans isomerase n=1 Tax=Ganoderma sinense ZZ0214-1 TaxID=1077348 RepID=A0A2G8S4X5_9APHY|nr:hypothetical protein GSI_08884 [Ganoderma sinense ZZ0214-1]
MPHAARSLSRGANAGANTNGSQFFITCNPTPHLDNKHVVFGEVVRGKSVVRAVENTETSSGDVPVEPCVIADCGQFSPEDPSLSQPTAADGDVYEDYPEDQDPVEGQDVSQHPPVALKIAREVREVGNRLFKEGQYEAALHKYQSAFSFLSLFSRSVLSPPRHAMYCPDAPSPGRIPATLSPPSGHLLRARWG